MHFGLIKQKIDRNMVIDCDGYQIVGAGNFDVFFFGWDFQILDDLIDRFANLIFILPSDHGEPGGFLHFVGELIFGDVGGNGAKPDENHGSEEKEEENGLDLTFAALVAGTEGRQAGGDGSWGVVSAQALAVRGSGKKQDGLQTA
jgi:hypothetical protein